MLHDQMGRPGNNTHEAYASLNTYHIRTQSAVRQTVAKLNPHELIGTKRTVQSCVH